MDQQAAGSISLQTAFLNLAFNDHATNWQVKVQVQLNVHKLPVPLAK